MAPDNTSLGQFNLDGLPPASRGVPKIARKISCHILEGFVVHQIDGLDLLVSS